MSDTVLPLGYSGALRLRVAPKIVLNPAAVPLEVVRLQHLVRIRGTSQNLAEKIPCSLEWHIRTNLIPSGVVTHRRPLEALPTSDGFRIQEPGSDFIVLDAYELGLVGTGFLGYAIRLQLTGAEDVVVPPEKSGIKVNLPIQVRFDRRTLPDGLDFDKLGPPTQSLSDSKLCVGSFFSIQPAVAPAFTDHVAQLVVREMAGDDPLTGTEQTNQWTVAEAPPKDCSWWAGMQSTHGPHCATYGKHPCADGSHEYAWELTLREPPVPVPGKKALKPGRSLRVAAQPAGAMPHPVLGSFELKKTFLRGDLWVEGSFSGFDPKLSFDLELHVYAQFTPVERVQPSIGAAPDSKPFTPQALPTAVSVPFPATKPPPSKKVIRLLRDEISIDIAQAVTVTNNRFEAKVLSLDALRKAAGWWMPDLRVFAELCFPAAWCSNGKEPIPFSQLAHYKPDAGDGEGHVKGLVPFRQGRFASYAFGTGVCSGAIDLAGNAAALEKPVLETHWKLWKPAFEPHQNKYDDLILQYANQYDLDPLIFKSLIAQESAFDPDAANKWGYVGLTQVGKFWIDVFRKEEHVPDPVGKKDPRLDPEYSIHIGAFALSDTGTKYRSFLEKKGYSVADEEFQKLTIAAYNIGIGVIEAASDELSRASKPITWEAVCGNGESSPLWRGIDRYKNDVCGYHKDDGTYSFTVAKKYEENSTYVERILARTRT